MEKEYINLAMETCIQAVLLLVKNTVSVNMCIQMVTYMRDNGKMT